MKNYTTNAQNLTKIKKKSKIIKYFFILSINNNRMKNNINDAKGKPTHWTSEKYNTNDLLNAYGFVYLVTTHDGKKYIGKCKIYDSTGRQTWQRYRGTGRDIVRHYHNNNHDYSLYNYTILNLAYNEFELAKLEQHYIDKHNAKNSDEYLNINNAYGRDSKILNIPHIELDNISGSYSETIRTHIKSYFIDKPKLDITKMKDKKITQVSMSQDLYDMVNLEAKRLKISALTLVNSIFNTIR